MSLIKSTEKSMQKNAKEEKKTLKTALMICFSVLLLGNGCASLRGYDRERWLLPAEPQIKPVKFVPQDDGFFLTKQDSSNLADNIDELKARIDKLEILIVWMCKYYKATLVNLDEEKITNY